MNKRMTRPGWHAGLALALLQCLLGQPIVALAQGVAVSLQEARAGHEAGKAILVDIREPDEHATGVVPGARWIPLSGLSAKMCFSR